MVFPLCIIKFKMLVCFRVHMYEFNDTHEFVLYIVSYKIGATNLTLLHGTAHHEDSWKKRHT